MAGQGEAADERGGFAFDSDLDVEIADAPEPEQLAPESHQSAAADQAPAKQDDGDDFDRASNLEELKAALKKRSPTRDDRAAIDARLAGVSEMERELLELRAWRKAQEEAKAPKKEDAKPVDEWDELLGKGPEFIRAAAQEIAKKEVEAAMQEVAKLRGELTEREQRAEFRRQAKSREALLQKHPDAHEKLLKFRDLVQKYPQLEDQAIAAEDPASFAYEQVERFERLSQYKSYDDFIRGEAARLAGQSAPPPAAQTQQPPAVPPKAQRRAPLTLAAVRGGNAAVLADDQDHFPNF